MIAVTPELAAATLVCLPDMSPTRMRLLVDVFGSPIAALGAVREGRAVEALRCTPRPPSREQLVLTARRWAELADHQVVARTLECRGTHVWVEGGDGFPIDEPVPNRPVILLAEGARPDALGASMVAVVGTRAASPHGLADARELGAFLAGAGATVVSGMAIGIDGAAHQGAVGAGGLTVGVVATGLDVEYPRRHRGLYHDVRAAGVVLGETGFGVRPDTWRFPIRNRIIAALADVVIVVEATITGGARITAQYALEYGRPVMAVPGSRRNRAAAGTNALIADGAHPLVDWSDVVIALGLSGATRPAVAGARPAPGRDGAALLHALGGEAATPDQLVSRAGLTPEEVAVALFELEKLGWIERAQGAIWPR